MTISIANMKEWTQEEEAANLKRLLSSVDNKAQFAKDNNVPAELRCCPNTKAATALLA